MAKAAAKRKPPATTQASPDLSAILKGMSANPGVLDEQVTVEAYPGKIQPKTPEIAAANQQRRQDQADIAERASYPEGTIFDARTFEPILPTDPRHPLRIADQAGALGLSVEEYLALNPLEPRVDPFPVLDPDGKPAVDAAPPDLTIGEALGPIQGDPELPTLRGFEMSDAPLPIPAINFEPEPEPIAASPLPAGVSSANAGRGVPFTRPAPLDGDILTPSAQRVQGYSSGTVVRYEGRIRILEAFQYLGRLDSAPTWIDRSWLGYADFDDLRKIEPGPCLRVPLTTGQNAICRIGDFCVQQEVVLQQGMLSDIRVEVWAKEDFVKNFMPVVD